MRARQQAPNLDVQQSSYPHNLHGGDRVNSDRCVVSFKARKGKRVESSFDLSLRRNVGGEIAPHGENEHGILQQVVIMYRANTTQRCQR